MNITSTRRGVLILTLCTLVLGFGSSFARQSTNLSPNPQALKQAMKRTVRSEKLSGMAYGPFREGQSPERGLYPTLDEVRQDISLLKRVSNGIRTYGCRHLETVVTASKEASLNLALGAWLSGNPLEDQAEIDCAVNQAQLSPNIVSIVAGNESIFNNWLSVAKVCTYVQYLREHTNLPITTAEPLHIWWDHTDLASCVDYLLVHIHPYWECQSIENAVSSVQTRYDQIPSRYPDKRIVIGETGWPSAGTGREEPCGPMPTPSPEEQSRFACGFLEWSENERVDHYFFEAFDEPWKCEDGRPQVECHWGIYYKDRTPKPPVRCFLPFWIWLPLTLNH